MSAGHAGAAGVTRSSADDGWPVHGRLCRPLCFAHYRVMTDTRGPTDRRHRHQTYRHAETQMSLALYLIQSPVLSFVAVFLVAAVLNSI